MNCKRTEKLINEYINGELTSVEMTQVKAHLDTCESCRKMAEETTHVRTLLQSYQVVTTNTDIRKNVLKMIEEDYEKNLKKRFSLAKFFSYGSIAAIIVLFIAISPQYVPKQETTANNTTPTTTNELKRSTEENVKTEAEGITADDATFLKKDKSASPSIATKQSKKSNRTKPQKIAQVPKTAFDKKPADTATDETYQLDSTGLPDEVTYQELHVATDHSEWSRLQGVQGPAGPMGPAGPAGPMGSAGAIGPAGTVAVRTFKQNHDELRNDEIYGLNNTVSQSANVSLLIDAYYAAETYMFSAKNYIKFNDAETVYLTVAEPTELSVNTPQNGQLKFIIEPIKLYSDKTALIQIYYDKEHKDILLPFLLEKNIISPQDKK